ncbi:MAG: FGGY family carbohydrate kinase [Bacillota bacterium]
MRHLFLGLDIGTLGTKGTLADASGQVLARHYVEHPVIRPRPGWSEHEPAAWWDDVCAVTRNLLQGAVEPAHIGGICVSGLTPCVGLVDSDGNLLRNGILYSDNRAVRELDEVNALLPEPITLELVVPKLLWLKRHEPERFARTAVVLNANSYAIYRLTGKPSVDVDNAAMWGGVFDPQRLCWDLEACSRLGIPAHLLPPLYTTADIVGAVTDRAAAATGLAPGTPVVCGTGDSFFALLGAGVINQGDMMVNFAAAGTSIICNVELERVVRTVHLSDKRGVVRFGASILTTGDLVRWYRDQFGQAELAIAAATGESPYALLDQSAAQMHPGSDGLVLLPHFMGRRTPTANALARGTIFGLTTFHTSAHIFRAALESFAYGVLESMPGLDGAVQRVVATGGGAASPLWRQIMADALGRPLEHVAKAEGPLGAAFLAGYATGRFSSFQDIRDWLPVTAKTVPDPEAHAAYQRLYAVYRQVEASLEGCYLPLHQALEAVRP